nr:transcription antitermination factor NusB [Eubacterium sp.]
MTRRELREQMFVLLFQKEFYGKEFEEQLESYFSTHEYEEKEKEQLLERLEKVSKVLPDVDNKISEYSQGWKIDRIGKEELAILRLAVFEAVYDEDIPVGVAINEAVELGKKYGADGGAAFINGMLGNIVNE